ncbi:MAG: dienelactone hydrolase family protein [Betaproteobacteria bacterium]|nr:MAG: dienelactone hydrolase family protein [Betaproteobacteria bacterium]
MQTNSTLSDAKRELDSLVPALPLNRRGFIVTSLGAGFAAATLPIAAQTAITTSADGLVAGEVKVPTKDGDIPAYRAMPATGSGFPVVLVVQEIFGVHEHIKDVCRRFAKAGYFAIAAEMFARQGDVSKMTDVPKIISDVVSKVPDSQVMADLDACVAYARASGKANADKLAVTGFCWGGRITWLYAAHNQNVKAGGAWYGRLVGQASANTPKHPIDLVAQINAPVLGLYGDADTGIPNDTVARMEDALRAAGKKSEIILYPDAPHAFHADYRPSYRKATAEDAWKKLIDWFKKHGAA